MKKAFTLIEILVVCTIIGLLAAGAAVSYSQFTRQSRDARRKADVEQIRAALEMYRSNDPNGYYIALASSPSTGSCTTVLSYASSYLTKIPTDPKSTSRYYCNITTTSYSVATALENGSGLCGTANNCTIDCNYSIGPYGQTCP